jgi:hypothetical protein
MAKKTLPTSFESIRQQGGSLHRELLHYVSNDVTFPTAYLKAVASIAGSDGVLNVAEFNALNDVTSLLNDSALGRVVLLEYIEHPLPLKVALLELEKASVGIDQATATAAFMAARALMLL